MMRPVLSTMAAAAVLAACGQPEQPPAPEAAPEPAAVAEPTPEPLDDAALRQVCRAVLAAVNELPLELIEADGVEAGVADLSWRAPVDGGRAHAQCRVSGDVAEWRLTDLPDPAAEVWRTGPADPIVRYVREDGRITVIQTFPDGTSSRTEVSGNTEQEAR